MTEIERKFLVREMPKAESGRTVIEQGYLALDELGEVRLRRLGGKLLLTAKSGSGLAREEVEVPVEPRAFEALWPLTAGRRLRKVRHDVPLGGGLRAEVDVYGGELDGLLTAEVEFDSPAEADRFAPPAWMGEELTGDERYANRSLATAGLPAEAAKRDDTAVRIEATEDARRGAASATADARPEGTSGTAPAGGGGGGPGGSTPTRAYRLLDDEGAAAGVRRVIAGRLDKAAERLREGGDGEALADAIHGARKDLKKARAALRLIREGLGAKSFRRENRTLRDAARLLSAGRDAEVKAATLDSLVEGKADAPPGATAIWRDALAADRDRVAAESSGEGKGDAIADSITAIDAVAGRAPGWKIGADGWKLLAPGLATAYREGRREVRALGAEPSSEAVHDLRKRGKDLWYQLRLLENAWPGVLDATAEEVHDFTEKLGDHHDLAVLAEDLRGRTAVAGADRATLEALIEARQARLLTEARGLGARIYTEKPAAFERRLRAYWVFWRRDPA